MACLCLHYVSLSPVLVSRFVVHSWPFFVFEMQTTVTEWDAMGFQNG